MKVTAGQNPYKNQKKDKTSKLRDSAYSESAAKIPKASHDIKTQGADRQDIKNFDRLDLSHSWRKQHPDNGMTQLKIDKPTVSEKVDSESVDAELRRQELEYLKENNLIYDGPLEWHVSEKTELILATAPEPKYPYPESIYDIPAKDLLTEVESAAMACYFLNVSEMTDPEIYNAMLSIFEKYLGKDFREPNLLYNVQSEYNWREDNNYLGYGIRYFELAIGGYDYYSDAHINLREHPEILVEARGYTGMSKSEMRESVREQYPETMTLKDCILMADELWNLGLENKHYGFGTINYYKHMTNVTGSLQNNELYNSLLDMPADYDKIKASFAKFERSGINQSPPTDAGQLRRELLSWFS